MPTTTFPCNKDARIAQSGSLNLGAGKSNYLPVGLSSGYLYRSLLGFSYSFTGMVAITSAVLHIKTSSQHYLGFGSDPDVNIYRIIEAWSEGTADGLSGSNAVHWGNQPAIDATESTGASAVPTTENTWWTCDITNLMQEALADGTFYGLRLRSSDESNSNDRTEFYAREYGSNDAYIEVTYTSNTAPTAPTLETPRANANATPRVPGFGFTHNDPQSDPATAYQVQVNAAADGSGTVLWDSGTQTSGISGGTGITRAYAGAALAQGTAYYWRARTYDGALWGPYSGWRKFTTVYAPGVNLTEPGGAGVVAKVSYTAGSGWSTPRLNVAWTFSDADGGSQTHYQLQVGTTPGSGNLYDSTMLASTANVVVVPLNLTEGQVVYVRVRVRCSHGEDSAYSAERNVRTRWGMARFFANLGSAPTQWSVSALVTTRPDAATSNVVVEYGSNGSAAVPASYFSTLASVPKQQYFHYRVWLMAWGSATPSAPSLDKLVLSYSAVVISPDHWTLPATYGSIDESTRVFGTQSLKLDGAGSPTNRAYQPIVLEPDTHYIAQCRIKGKGAADAKLIIGTSATGGFIFGSPAVNDTADEWRQVTFEFDSGDLTEAFIQCSEAGAVGTSAWFDAVKIEASTVASPWTPGFLSEGIVLDAGGVAIDASNGGVFRGRGSIGAANDVVELATHGLRFGGVGGAEVYGSNPAGGLVATPGSWTNIRGIVAIPFSWAGTLVNGTPTDMPFFESANAIAQMRLPFSGQVVGIVISSPANRSAGTLSAQVFNGSTSLLVGPAAVFDGTVANNATGNAPVSALIDIGAGQFYRLRLTPTGYAPLATSIKGIVYIALNNA